MTPELLQDAERIFDQVSLAITRFTLERAMSMQITESDDSRKVAVESLARQLAERDQAHEAALRSSEQALEEAKRETARKQAKIDSLIVGLEKLKSDIESGIYQL